MVQHRVRKPSAPKQTPKNVSTKICKICLKEKKENEFYKVNSVFYPDGTMDICSECLKEGINPDDIDSVVSVLRQMNKPFIRDVWEASVEKSSTLQTKPHPFGEYMKRINALKQYADKTFKDSKDVLVVSDIYGDGATKIDRLDGESINFDSKLILKWGENYSQAELLKLEKFYQDMLLQYEITTPIQFSLLEQLATVSVEMEKAIKEGDITRHSSLVKSQESIMKSAGFRPVDKKNISDETGLSSFSEVWAEIEREGFIPPKLLNYPKDDIDNMLLYYLQGVQRFTDSSVSSELDDENWRENAEIYREQVGDYDVITRSKGVD